MRLFEDVVHNIASIRAVLGHIFHRAKDFNRALQELEAGCPNLWIYKSSWRSLETDVRSIYLVQPSQ